MYCMKCGTKNDAESRFCISCGNPMTSTQNQVNNARQQTVYESALRLINAHKKWIIIGASILLVLIVVIALATSGGDNIPRNGGRVTVQGTTDFTFRPNSSGIWIIETSQESYQCDPYLRIYDGSVLIESDDDSGYDLNAFISVYLYAGTTYTISAGFYDSYSIGSYVLVVRRESTW